MANDTKPVSAADKAIGVPRVGIGVVVLNSENKVLIGKRKSPHGQGMFHVTK
jgi:ADP-ribose pyrophosphatase YjhB (NUDIX family)